MAKSTVSQSRPLKQLNAELARAKRLALQAERRYMPALRRVAALDGELKNHPDAQPKLPDVRLSTDITTGAFQSEPELGAMLSRILLALRGAEAVGSTVSAALEANDASGCEEAAHTLRACCIEPLYEQCERLESAIANARLRGMAGKAPQMVVIGVDPDGEKLVSQEAAHG